MSVLKCFGLGFCLFTAPVFAQATVTQDDAIVKIAAFLETRAVGKTMHLHSNTVSAEGTLAFDFDLLTTYTDLERTGRGLRFNTVSVVKQTNTDIINGVPTGTPRNVNRTITASCELTSRRSTGAVMGFCRSVSNTLSDGTGYAESLTAELVADTLVMRIATVGYADFFAAGDTYEPAMNAGVLTLSVVKGKLQRQSRYTSVRLNRDTLVPIESSREVREQTEVEI